MVYLGFLETLQGILGAIFEKVLSPILTSVFNTLFKLFSDLIWESLSQLLLDGLLLLLKILHFLVNMFNVYSGNEPIVYKISGGSVETTLLEYFFQLNGIGRAFVMFTIIGGILAFMFAVYETGRTISDNVLGESKPISKVLQNGIKSMLSFVLIPVLCVFLLQFSNVILQQIEITFAEAQRITYGNGTNLEVDDIIFNCVAKDAAKDANAFEKKYQNTTQSYTNREAVEKDLNIEKIDYLTGFISIILMALILMGASIAFIRRCFDLLFLYLISPVFSATIALDGGSRFSKWREKFVGKFFAAFGSVFIMRLYLLIIPFFSNGLITYSADDKLNAFMRIMFILGGAWAVYKGQGMLTQLLLGQSSDEEMDKAKFLALAAGGAVKNGIKGIAGSFKKSGKKAG